MDQTQQYPLKGKRKLILEFIIRSVHEKGYPPSVREIGEAVGLASPSTVHSHLSILEKQGFIYRDPTKPRALEVRFDPNSGEPVRSRPHRSIPVVGEIAAGTNLLAQQNIEDFVELPEEFTGTGTLFILRVRGDSMIEAGIFDRDFVVIRSQPTANQGEIVAAGIHGGESDEGTVKYYFTRDDKVILRPANQHYSDIVLSPDEVEIYGKVVTVLRKL